MASTSEQKTSNRPEDIARLSKDIYNEAYAVIDQGVCFDEVGQVDNAIRMYDKGLQLIDMANEIPNGDRGETYNKMNLAKKHILSRLNSLNGGTAELGASSNQPLDDINTVLSCMGNTKNAEELLFIPDGVQLFFIKGDDASVPSYPSYLKVFKFTKTKEAAADVVKRPESSAPAFLQVGDWVYPLVPNRSPVLHSAYDAYIFPDPTVECLNSYVGVILPKDLDQNVVKQFEKFMSEFTAYKVEQEAPPLSKLENERFAKRIAGFLLDSTDTVVYHMTKGSDKAHDLIRQQSEKAKASTTPDQAKNVTIDPRVQTSIHYLRSGSKVAVKVSGYLVDKIGALGAAIGRRVASSVDKRLQSNSTGAKVAHDVLEVTSAGVAGVSTIFVALEEISKKLARCLASETVTVVNHKYGTEAATVTDKALYTAGFAAQTAWNIECLGLNSMARRSAKSASLAFLKDFSENQPAKPNANLAQNVNEGKQASKSDSTGSKSGPEVKKLKYDGSSL